MKNIRKIFSVITLPTTVLATMVPVLTACKSATEAELVKELHLKDKIGTKEVELTKTTCSFDVYSTVDGSEIKMNEKCNWKITDAEGKETDIAEISDLKGSKGEITLKKTGTVTVTATYSENTNITESFELKVVDSTEVTSIKINGNSKVEIVGLTTIKYGVLDQNSKDISSDCNWSPSNPDIAEVDDNGNVTFKETGTVSIKATYKWNTKLTDTITITVSKTTVAGLTIKGDTTQYVVPDVSEPVVKYQALSNYLSDETENCNWEIIDWSSKEKYPECLWAEVNNGAGHKGEITFKTAEMAGGTYITVQTSLITNPKIVNTLTIEIKIPEFTTFTIGGNPEIESTGEAKTAQYKALVEDTINITQFCNWESSNETIATIDETGLATFTGNIGETTFTARYKGAPETKYATLTVKVVPLTLKFIDDSETIKNPTIDSQKETELVYTFKTKDETLTTADLTALAQVDEGETITVNPKVYVEVENKIITAKVTYDASNVTSLNEKVKFHISFANTKAGHTWAQTIEDLTINYSSPFMDYNTEQAGYLFCGQGKTDAASRIFYFNYDTSITDVSCDVTYKAGSGITLGAPVLATDTENKKISIELPYNTADAEIGDYLYFSINLKCKIDGVEYTQSYDVALMAVDNLYIVDQKTTIDNGSAYGWYYMWLALPLGEDETADDITVTLTQDTTSSQPMYIECYAKQMDANRDYVSFIFNVKNSYITPNTTAKFNMTVEKLDHRPSSTTGDPRTNGTAGWHQDFTDLELTFNGSYVEANHTQQTGTVMSIAGWNYFDCTTTFKLSDSNDKISNYNVTFTPKISSIPDGCEKVELNNMFDVVGTSYGTNTIKYQYKGKEVYEYSWPSTWESYHTAHPEEKFYVYYDCDVTLTRKDVATYQKQTFTIKNWLRLCYDF